MTRYLRIQADSCSDLEHQIIQYFVQSGFKLVEQNSNSLKFIRSSSFFDSWKFNPLRWGSDVIISIHNHEIEAKFIIDTAAKIVTADVKEAWKVFIENLEQYVVHGIPFEKANSEAAEKAKQSIIKKLAWTILAIIIGGLVGIIISHFTGWTLISYIGILSGAFLVLKNERGEENVENAVL